MKTIKKKLKFPLLEMKYKNILFKLVAKAPGGCFGIGIPQDPSQISWEQAQKHSRDLVHNERLELQWVRKVFRPP